MSPRQFLASNRRVLSNRFGYVVFVLVSLYAIQGLSQIAGAAGSRTVHRAAGPNADFYVASDGRDSWSGTLPDPNSSRTDGPFASIARAQLAVQSLIKTHPNRPIVVMVRSGNYYLPLSPTNPGTLNFTSADSGSSQTPIVWENYPQESPKVIGGEAVGPGGLGLTWKQTSGNLWQVRLPAGTQPFEGLFYNGKRLERRLRSRLQSSLGTGYYMNGGSCYSTVTTQTVDISYCNLGAFLRIAGEISPGNSGCPSVSDGTRSKCLDRFQYNPGDPIAKWANLNGRYTGDPSNPCKTDNSNPYPAGDVELTLFNAWTVDVMRINCVDTNNQILYLTGPTQGSSGNYDYFGPAAGHRYIVENAKEAFDQEQQDGQTGIWFLDQSSVPFTLSYVAKNGENPNLDTVVVPQVQPATSTGGSILSATQINYVTFQGITFEVDNFMPPPYGFNNDENGESTLPAAVDCESCQHVTFDSILVRHTSASGIQIASLAGHSGPPSAHDVIQNSAFYDLGGSGVHIGHTPHGSDVAASVVHSITVQNNVVQGYSRVFADGEGIAQGNGNFIYYLHNDISDGYHSGISICVSGCSGENGNHVLSQYNHIWNVMQGITSDGGGIYYLVGYLDHVGKGNRILNNLVHDVNSASVIDQGMHGTGYGGHGIYLDAMPSGVSIENNVVYRASSETITISLGPGNGQAPNTLKNNIFAYARKGMFGEGVTWPQNCTNTTRVNITGNIMYFDLTEATAFYAIHGCADSCGMAFNQFENFQRNLYWRTDGKFAQSAKAFHVLTNPPPPDQARSCSDPPKPSADWTFLDFSSWQTGHPKIHGKRLTMNEDLEGTVSVDPGFGKTGQPTDFLLSKAPVSGFNYHETNKTIQTAGRTSSTIKPPGVPQTFPTYYYTVF